MNNEGFEDCICEDKLRAFVCFIEFAGRALWMNTDTVIEQALVHHKKRYS